MTPTEDPLYQFDIENDQQAMALALIQAGFGMLDTTPNPRVGCVIVKDRRVIGAGFTQPPGGNHAEIQAMADALLTYETLDANDVDRIMRGETLTRPSIHDMLDAESKRRPGTSIQPGPDASEPDITGGLTGGPLPSPG